MSERTMQVGIQYRNAPVAVRAAEGDAPATMTVALSSEYPVLRFDWMTGERYMEVLSHEPSDVDLSRAARGLPLLMDHDSTRQAGRLMNVRVEDGRLVADMKFSRSQLGQEAEQDVTDGIREEVSIGYRVLRMTKVGEEDGVPVMRAQWMPYEGTLTAVPADPTVGVGREADRAAFVVPVILPEDSARKAEEATMADEKQAAPAPETTRAVVDESGRKAAAEIAALCASQGKADRASKFIADGLSVEQAKAVLFDEAVRQSKAEAPSFELSPREEKAYSLLRAIGAATEDNWTNAGFEKEVNDHLADLAGKRGSTSIFIPTQMQVRALGSTTSGSGAEFKFNEEKPFTDLLREKMVVSAAGATVLTGLGGPAIFPVQTAAGAASWRTEIPGSDLSDTDSTYSTVALTAKTVQRNTAISRQSLFINASYDMEALVRSDLAAVLALAIDAAAINGGTSNAPTGLLSNTSISTVTLGANAGTITYAALVNLEKTVAQGNADIGRLACVTNAQQRAQARQVQQFSGTNGVPLWVGGANGGDGQMAVGEILGPNGYSAYVSQNVPANLTKGTSTTICSAWIFGNWAELLVGSFGPSFELIVDPYSKKKQALIEITAMMYADVAVRHAASFAKIQDAL